MNIQRVTEEEKATNEYSGHMEQSNTLLNERLEAKYVYINIASVSDWNQLSIDEINPEFDNEFHKVISDDDAPHADGEQPKEEPTHTPEMFDSYIDMEIGLPRELNGELYHAKVSRCSVDRYEIAVGVEILTQSLIQESMT